MGVDNTDCIQCRVNYSHALLSPERLCPTCIDRGYSVDEQGFPVLVEGPDGEQQAD